MENREITFLSHYRYVINNEDKTKPVECTEFLYQHFIHQASWLQLNNGINIKNPPMLCFYLHVSDKINTDFPLDLEISFIQQNSYS